MTDETPTDATPPKELTSLEKRAQGYAREAGEWRRALRAEQAKTASLTAELAQARSDLEKTVAALRQYVGGSK